MDRRAEEQKSWSSPVLAFFGRESRQSSAAKLPRIESRKTVNSEHEELEEQGPISALWSRTHLIKFGNKKAPG